MTQGYEGINIGRCFNAPNTGIDYELQVTSVQPITRENLAWLPGVSL